ncbi:MAG: hypothetical protein OXF56_01110 [Rhodobacteraceae bacterium]|nr:hypothetical protein [Paracoccaceae bacterium]
MGKTRSARGTVEEPGRNVASKAGLNREILATGWYGLKAKLAYICTVEGVDRAYMTLTCTARGHVDKVSRRTQSDSTCVACDHADDADRNIMTSGIGHSSRRGAFALATPVTRDIDRKLKA